MKSINLSNPQERRQGRQQLSLQEPVDFTADAAIDIRIDETRPEVNLHDALGDVQRIDSSGMSK